MVKKKNSILSCLLIVLCLIVSMPAVIWASETVVSSLSDTAALISGSGDLHEAEDMPETTSEVNSVNSVERVVSGNIIPAASGVEHIPSLLKDGSYGMVKGQKWFAGAGASSFTGGVSSGSFCSCFLSERSRLLFFSALVWIPL